MISRQFLLRFIVPCLIGCSVWGDTITWVGQDNNMHDSGNWNPSVVPGAGDTAVFSSKIQGVNKHPESNGSFNVANFNFPFSASPFTLTFNNGSLTFNGNGVTGAHTNATIDVLNNNNGSSPGDLISFLGFTGTSGSAAVTSSNSASFTGSMSGTGSGPITSHLYSNGAFLIADGGSITASNTANDSTTGNGNNGTGNTGSGQLKFDQSFTAGDDVAVSISNSGTFSGTNSSQGNAVAIVNGSQFIASGAFVAGDNFNFEVENSGHDSCVGVGLSNIGQLNAAQVLLQTTGTVGDDCSITLSNTGINSSQTTSFPDFIGYLNDQQFFAGDSFQASDNFSLSVSNTGSDTSTGYGGHQIAVINSNSGTTGNQILFKQGCALGDHATINASNSGDYSGTNTNGGSNVAGMNLQQIAIGDNSSAFTVGDHMTLSASNHGEDSSTGLGGNAVGTVSSDQIALYSPTVLGSHANITASNSGEFSGQASSVYVNVGSAGGSQLNCTSSFSVGHDFTMNLSNSGTNSGSGVGGYFIGDLITGSQASFQNNVSMGDNASIFIENIGSNSSNTTSNNQVGSLMGYGKQFLAKNSFQSGDNLHMEISNLGLDASTGAGGNFAGFINNNTVDNTASQLHLDQGGTVGKNATIEISNIGAFQGSTSNNTTGVLAGQQMCSEGAFQAGDNFFLTVFNGGVDEGSGQNDNSAGTVGGAQIEFGGTCTLGNNARVAITNIGVNSDSTGTSNNIGVVNGSQMLVFGNFEAGTNLDLSAYNLSINAGDPSNFVGELTSCQFDFVQNCTLNDGASIRAFNNGNIACSQILLDEGFTVASGKATIEAINEGTIGQFGIDIEGASSGGNADIILGNSSLNIGTTLPTFTIASLEGDSTSFVQSQPQLVINTDAKTNTEFSGVIQDYPASSSTLLKTGPGTQTLTGANTYTGLTTVDEGILVLNGSLAGDVLTNPLGTLKGNGTIAGTLTNTGLISPGQSIGTMFVGNFVNNGGNYAVEVNGLGQSDLIDASGTALLSGGTVLVSSDDGTFRFQQPYTIVTADGGVTGAFADATSFAFVNPTLTYDLNNVYLTLFSDLTAAAVKCNQLGVAINLDQIIDPTAAQSLLISAIANLPLTKVQEALESLSGFQYTQDVLVTEVQTSRLLRRLYDPLRSLVINECCTCSEWTPWIETGYGYTTADDLNVDSYQITSGIQKSFNCDLTFGAAGSYEHDTVHYSNGRADRDTGFAAVYGLYRPNIFYGLVNAIYGYSENRVKRTIEAGIIRYKARSKPHFNTFAFYAEAGFDIQSDCYLVQPFIGIQTGRNWRSLINENNANGFGLTVNSHNWTSTRSRLGLHLTSFSDSIQTSLDLAWNNRWNGTGNATTGRFNQFGDSFPICGSPLDHNSIDYALTFTSCLSENLNGYFELDGEWWKHVNTFNVIGGLVYTW